MDSMDSRTIAFLAVAAFMSLLLLCCIILSILFYIRYRNAEFNKDDRDNCERQRLKKLKEKLMKQFKNEVKKQNNKRPKPGKVAPAAMADDIATACSICLDSLAEGDTSDTVLALLVKCGHVYHMECVWPWLERDRSCPICRRDMELNMSNVRAVTVYHVFSNIDVQSIRESVSRVDLHSRLAYDLLEVVSVNEDDLKTQRSPRTPHVIPVLPADVTDSDTFIMTGESSGENAANPSVSAGSAVYNPSTHSSSLQDPSLIVNCGSLGNNGSLVTNPSHSDPNVIFTIGGGETNGVSDV